MIIPDRLICAPWVRWSHSTGQILLIDAGALQLIHTPTAVNEEACVAGFGLTHPANVNARLRGA